MGKRKYLYNLLRYIYLFFSIAFIVSDCKRLNDKSSCKLFSTSIWVLCNQLEICWIEDVFKCGLVCIHDVWSVASRGVFCILHTENEQRMLMVVGKDGSCFILTAISPQGSYLRYVCEPKPS